MLVRKYVPSCLQSCIAASAALARLGQVQHHGLPLDPTTGTLSKCTTNNTSYLNVLASEVAHN